MGKTASTELNQHMPPPAGLDRLDRLLGPSFFFLSVAFLLLAAGVIHRVSHGYLTMFEEDVLLWGVVILWPIFVAESFVRLLRCHRPGMPLRNRLAYFLAVCLAPPLRMGGRSYADRTRLWLPRFRWTTVDQHLRCRLERVISVPMVIIALMVLPLLAMEYFWLDQVRAHFGLSLLLDLGTAVIWVAFALEFIVMASVSEDIAGYCWQNWMNLAVVALPLVDFMPILRLVRLTGLLEVQQVSRLGRLYRLRGLLARIWRAILLLEMIQRLFGNYQDKRLKRLKKMLAAREAECAGLRQQIAEVELLLSANKISALAVKGSSPPLAESAGGA